MTRMLPPYRDISATVPHNLSENNVLPPWLA
jgi:hypothetical protein